MKRKTIYPEFCTFAEWQPYLPPEFQSIPLSVWLAKGRRGDWAPYTKQLGERSTPYWRRRDIVARFLQFAAIHPEYVRALTDAFDKTAREKKGDVIIKRWGC